MYNLLNFKPGIPELIVLAVFLITFFYQLYYYLRYINVSLNRERKIRKNKIQFEERKLPVSVIICARNETENLKKFLPEVLRQEYPDYEVIVVNDGGSEETEILLRDMKLVYPHLRSTFVPDGTTNLSTKKLALTLGIKAAKNDWLLFTDADCIPENAHWISSMARNFAPKTEFVLGYGAYFTEKGFLNKLISYDTLFNALQYLGFANAGHPYMGVGRNLAYRKEVFFRQNGFASTLHLRSGDDDLMVNQSANKHNTRIETSPDSITWSAPEKSFRAWYYQKERHLSVSTFYRTSGKVKLVIEPFSRGLFYLSFIALTALSLLNGNFIITASGILLFLVRFAWQLLIINKTSRYYSGRKYFLNLIVLDIILPLISAFIMTFGRMGRKAVNISWK